MRTRNPLAGWDAAVTAFLTSRRALGRAYGIEEWILNNLRTFLVKAGADDLDQQLFDRWREPFCRLSVDSRVARERVVYRFCRYRRRGEPGCFFPDLNSLARPRAQPLPTIIEREQIVRLLRYVSRLQPKPHETLRPAVLRLAIILLYTTGLRRGELVRLTWAMWMHAKAFSSFGSPSYTSPDGFLSPEARREELRRLSCGAAPNVIDSTWATRRFCATTRAESYAGAGFHRSLADRHLWPPAFADAGGRHPRVQDFRHSFAVAALLRWYENDADVQVNLPKLALYMGHVSIVSTAYYLRCMPAVVAQAGERFARAFGDLVDGGAP